MKSTFAKITSCALLSTCLLLPMGAQAEDPAEAINAMNTNLGGILSDMNNSQKSDFTRKDLATALINYEALARIREYQLHRELLFMQAPGIAEAVTAGKAIGAYMAPVAGGNALSKQALSVSDNSLASLFKNFTKSSSISMDGETINVASMPSSKPGDLYTSLGIKEFVTSGTGANIAVFNPAAMMQKDTLAAAGLTPQQANQMISVITQTNQILSGLTNSIIGIDENELGGADVETLMNALGDGALLSLSTNALSDIVARRQPANGQSQSVMQTMGDYSGKRFTNPDWYKAMSASSDSAILREISHMMAYNMWVQYQQFRVQEQQVALLASLNSVMSKINSTIDNLTAQIAKSTAEASAKASAAQQELKQQLEEQQ